MFIESMIMDSIVTHAGVFHNINLKRAHVYSKVVQGPENELMEPVKLWNGSIPWMDL